MGSLTYKGLKHPVLGLLSELLLQHAPLSSSGFLQPGSLLIRVLALLDVVLVEAAKVGVGVGAVPALGNLAGVVADGHHSVVAHAFTAKARTVGNYENSQ